MKTLPPPRQKFPLWANQSQEVRAATVMTVPPDRELIVTPEERWQTSVSRRPMPSTVESILISGLEGDLADQAKLFSNMVDTWPRLANNMRALRQEACNAPFCVHAWTDMDGKTNAEADKRKKLVEHALWEMLPDESSMEIGAEGLFSFLAEGTIYGHTVAEILWEIRRMPDGTEAVMPRACQQVDAVHYSYPGSSSVTYRDRLMLKQSINSSVLEDFPQNKFIIQVERAHRDHPAVSARMRALAKYWLGGVYGWEWLLVYAQLFGSPFRWANYDTSNPQAKQAVCGMLANMGNSGWGAFPAGTELKFIEASKSGGELPQALVGEIADLAADLVILGHTQQTKQNAGSRATEVERSSVRRETMKAVCGRVAATLTQQFVRSVCFLNYGNYDFMPEVRCDIPDAAATVDEVSAFNTLQQMGMKFPTEWLHNRYGIPIPDDSDDVMEPMPPPVSPVKTPVKASSINKVNANDDISGNVPGLEDIYEIVMKASFAEAYDRFRKNPDSGEHPNSNGD